MAIGWLLGAVTALLSACSSLPPVGERATPMHQGRELVWHDEFDGDKLNGMKWRFRRTMDGKDCLYANDARTYAVKDGALCLWARRSDDPEKPFLLPEGVSTLDTMNYRYGYLEMRARVPYRHGAWPSFWLQSAKRSRSVDWLAETDVFEIFSSSNTVVSTIHKWRDHKDMSFSSTMMPGGCQDHVFVDCSKLNDEFHVYGYEWTPKAMKFYVDGNLYCTMPIDEANDFKRKEGDIAGMGGFQDPQGIIINNEIFSPRRGGWCPKAFAVSSEDPFPFEYQVDWIRLWQRPNSEECITFDQRQAKTK